GGGWGGGRAGGPPPPRGGGPAPARGVRATGGAGRRRAAPRRERPPQRRAAHLHAVDGDGTDRLHGEGVRSPERTQRLGVARAVLPEAHVVADHDVPEIEVREQPVRYELRRRLPREARREPLDHGDRGAEVAQQGEALRQRLQQRWCPGRREDRERMRLEGEYNRLPPPLRRRGYRAWE